LAISYNESIIAAKILKVFKKTHEKPTVKGIIFEGEVLQGDEFNRIATLPSREESLTQLVAMFISPLTMFVNTLNASMSELVGVLRSLKEKKSE
jgi:large subunit ribosomal protein L10